MNDTMIIVLFAAQAVAAVYAAYRWELRQAGNGSAAKRQRGGP